MKKRIVLRRCLWLGAVLAITAVWSALAVRAEESKRDDNFGHSQEYRQILRGYEIAPVNLNLRGKDWELVGLGSYLVNTTGCNDCHTHPNWANNESPYVLSQQPGQINTPEYMAGGRIFGPVANPVAISANITPDQNGRPAGLTLAGFLEVMQTGHDPRDQPGDVLQVMPWPLYRWKIDRELIAMYEYLRAIPSLPDNPNPGP
jgi:hypothetical protein